MALYTKQFTKPYPGGYVDKPQKTTPVTADILNMQDNTLESLESFLLSSEVAFKDKIAVGTNNNVSGTNAAAFGVHCTASGNWSHAEGGGTTASAPYAHSEGYFSIASGTAAHAEGYNSKAQKGYSHAEGNATIATGNCQHVQGKFNIEDNLEKYAHIVGGGISNTDRKNIHTLDWQGNGWFAGDVTNGNGVSLDGLMALISTTGQLRTIVEMLPEEDISTSTIYMVLKENGSENDIYNEYINTDGTPEGWEFIGNSSVDLSDYYTKTQVDQLLSGYVQAETGKGLSSNDYVDADKQLVESIRNMTTAEALAILNETEGVA